MRVRVHVLLVLGLVLGCSSEPTQSDAGTDSPSTFDGTIPVRTFVLKKMFVGDTDRSFKTDPMAWRTLGEDLDGTMTDSCRASMPIADGDNGIDNSFGANVLPLLMQNGFAIPSLQWSESIQQGAARPVLVRMAAPMLSVRIGKLLGSPPDFFTGNGTWTVSSLVASELAMTEPQLGMMQAGPSSDAVLLLLPYGNTVLRLRVHRLSIHATTEMTAGSLAGILDTNELVEAARQAIGLAKPGACTAFDAIAASIRSAQDILADGTQNPNVDCNAISFGMGFEGATMGFGPTEMETPPPLACP